MAATKKKVATSASVAGRADLKTMVRRGVEFNRTGQRFSQKIHQVFGSRAIKMVSLTVKLVACVSLLLGVTQSTLANQEVQEKATVLLRGVVIDEAGDPVVGALVETISTSDELPKVSTKSVAGGAFLLRFPNDAYYGMAVIVHDETKQRAGYISGYEYTSVSQNIFRIALKPLRHTDVTVVDATGQPIADATVRMLIDYSDHQTGTTDAQGKIQLSFPDGAPVNWIVAYKDDCGFDYFENSTTFLIDNKAEVPREVRLTLNGAKRMQVKVVDSKDQPVAGVSVVPWTIQKAGKRDDANLSGLKLGKSDENGVAEFRYMPQDLMGSISFLIHDKNYHCPDLPRITAEDEQGQAVAKVYKVVTVRGKVTHDDGSPAVGVRLQGEGRGATNMYFRDHTSTKADGTYECLIYPDQDTLIAVTDEQYAAKSIDIPATAEGKLLENLDITLSRGFVVSGKLTQGEDRGPAVNETATLIQQGKNGSQLVRWSQSDKNGRYRFRVGPGSYTLDLIDGKTMAIEVVNEDLEFDSHVDRLPRGPLSGTVVDGAGDPVSALIIGESIGAPGHAGFTVQCKSDGTFATEKWNDKLRVIAVSAEKRLFGTREIEPDAEETEIVLAPAASLECSVVDENDKPIAGCVVRAYRQWAGTRLTVSERTDNEGKCSFAALGPGMTWTISASSAAAGTESIDFQIGEAKTYVVPTLRLDAAKKKEN